MFPKDKSNYSPDAIQFHLTALWQKNGPRSGKPLKEAIVGNFPDAASAAAYLLSSNPTGNWPYLFCYRLVPVPDHRYEYAYPVTILDRTGRIRGGYDHYQTGCFPGRMEADCQFKKGDIVQFGQTRLTLGVIEALPPCPDFVKKMKGENGLLDACDDTYLVLFGKGGKNHDHLHECEMFVPDAQVPRYITVLQGRILSGKKRAPRPVMDFYQKNLFFRWLADNPHLFSHEPVLVEEGDHFFRLRFRGITDHISCCFTETGDIMIMVDYCHDIFDIVLDFDLVETQMPDGRYLCTLCRDNPSKTDSSPVLMYESRDELWSRHSFEELAKWTRETFTDDTMLCLSRYGGITAAYIASDENLERYRKQERFFAEIPVVVERK